MNLLQNFWLITIVIMISMYNYYDVKFDSLLGDDMGSEIGRIKKYREDVTRAKFLGITDVPISYTI